MLKKISAFIDCKILGIHNYTSAAAEGIPPTEAQLNSGTDGFFDYAAMYCKDCGHVSTYSQRYKDDYQDKKS